MSVTRTIEISNYEKEQDEIEKSNFFMRTINYFSLDWFSFDWSNYEWFEMNWSVVLYIFLVLWIVFSILSIRKYLNCEHKFFYITLSILPIVNVVLYFGDFCKLSIEKYNNYNYNTRSNVNGQGVGFINSAMVYPSIVRQKMNNPPMNVGNNQRMNNQRMNNQNNNQRMNNQNNNRRMNNQNNNQRMNNQPMNVGNNNRRLSKNNIFMTNRRSNI
jgi:hypothetical protein